MNQKIKGIMISCFSFFTWLDCKKWTEVPVRTVIAKVEMMQMVYKVCFKFGPHEISSPYIVSLLVQRN